MNPRMWSVTMGYAVNPLKELDWQKKLATQNCDSPNQKHDASPSRAAIPDKSADGFTNLAEATERP
jgi:hypothetical protein